MVRPVRLGEKSREGCDAGPTIFTYLADLVNRDASPDERDLRGQLLELGHAKGNARVRGRLAAQRIGSKSCAFSRVQRLS